METRGMFNPSTQSIVSGHARCPRCSWEGETGLIGCYRCFRKTDRTEVSPVRLVTY